MLDLTILKIKEFEGRMEQKAKITATLLVTALLAASTLILAAPATNAAVESTARATFTETGLPSGIPWSVTCLGTQNSATTPNYIVVSGTNGHWSWSTGSIVGATGIQYVPSPASGSESGTKTINIVYSTQFQVSFTASSGGSVTTPASPQWYTKGTGGIAIAAAANTGYYFTSWTTTGSITVASPSSASTTITVNGLGTVTAHFAAYTYAVTVTQSDHGTISPATTNVNYGASQTFTITPQTGYHITDVVVDGASVGTVTSYQFTNVKTTHTITASYAITQIPTDLTVACTPATVDKTGSMNTIISGALTAGGSPLAGKTVTLTYNDGAEQAIGAATTQQDGKYSYPWTVPSSLANGFYVVTAKYTGDGNPYQSSTAQTSGGEGLFVLPEYTLGGLGALIALFGALGVVRIRRNRNKHP